MMVELLRASQRICSGNTAQAELKEAFHSDALMLSLTLQRVVLTLSVIETS